MTRHSEINKRAGRTVPRQCLADYGMHKDAAGAEGVGVLRSVCAEAMGGLPRGLIGKQWLPNAVRLGAAVQGSKEIPGIHSFELLKDFVRRRMRKS